jgi:hypothetical protein
MFTEMIRFELKAFDGLYDRTYKTTYICLGSRPRVLERLSRVRKVTPM